MPGGMGTASGMGAVFRWVRELWLNMFQFACCPYNGGVSYYVDNVSGDDANNGQSWAKAVKTIQKAIDRSNATIDWAHTPKHFNTIWIKPANPYAENLSFPFYCHMIGLGIRGTDTMAEIHPATGSAMAGTMLGTHLKNLWLEVDKADTPVLDIGIGNNSLIEDCVLAVGADVTGVVGIDTENCTHLTVRRCDFESGAHDFYRCIAHHGGADKFAHNVRIIDNIMFAYDTGIWIEDICTASQAVIQHNKIIATIIGVDDNNGASYVIENYIVSADPIDHAGGATHTIGNRVVPTATGIGAWEV